MILKETKTEAKMRMRAAADFEPYYKRVIEHKKACPFCTQTLIYLFSQGRNKCDCGYWSYSWLRGWKYQPKKEGEDEQATY